MRGTKTLIQPGVWRLRVYVGRRPNGSPIQASTTFRGGSRAADDELRRFVNKVGRSRNVERAATVEQLLEAWMANRRTATPLTLQGDQGYIDGRINPTIGHLRLDKLTGRDLDRAYQTWLAAGLSASTVQKLHAIISSALTQAVKWEWADRNIARLATPPRRTSGTVDRSIDPAELAALIRHARTIENETLAMAISLGAVTGARRGELLALRRADIDHARGVIRIARSMSKPNGAALSAGATKTRKSRVISADPGTLALLDWWYDRQEAFADAAGVPLDRNPYLLADPEHPRGDRPVLPGTLSRQFMRAARHLEMPYHFHELRHFAATTMITGGVDPRSAATRLGHARIQITLDLYAHAVEAADQRAAHLLGGHLPALPS